MPSGNKTDITDIPEIDIINLPEVLIPDNCQTCNEPFKRNAQELVCQCTECGRFECVKCFKESLEYDKDGNPIIQCKHSDLYKE